MLFLLLYAIVHSRDLSNSLWLYPYYTSTALFLLWVLLKAIVCSIYVKPHVWLYLIVLIAMRCCLFQKPSKPHIVDLSHLDFQMGSNWHWSWIKGRIEQHWSEWLRAAHSYNVTRLGKRKRKKVRRKLCFVCRAGVNEKRVVKERI